MVGMKGLFGERFCLQTNLKPEFVIGILRDHVGKLHRQRGDGGFDLAPLFDRITVKEEGSFVLWPTSQFSRNSFRPIWKCELEGGETGSRLKVKAKAPGFVLVDWLIWISGIMRISYPVLRLEGTKNIFSVIGIWGLICLFPLLSLLGFWLPEREARIGLQRILGGTFIDSK